MLALHSDRIRMRLASTILTHTHTPLAQYPGCSVRLRIRLCVVYAPARRDGLARNMLFEAWNGRVNHSRHSFLSLYVLSRSTQTLYKEREREKIKGRALFSLSLSLHFVYTLLTPVIYNTWQTRVFASQTSAEYRPRSSLSLSLSFALSLSLPYTTRYCSTRRGASPRGKIKVMRPA